VVRGCSVALVLPVVFSACAARHAAGLHRFVKGAKVEVRKVSVVQPRSHGAEASTFKDVAARARRDPSPTLMTTLETRDPELSAAMFELAIGPTSSAHRRVAERYRKLGILDAAYDHFLEASRIQPSDGAAYEGLARVWRDWGFPQLGVADADRAIYYAPSSASAHNTLATLLTALGRWAEARPEYQRAVALEPGAAYALNNLCYLSFLEGDSARAVDECRAALAIDPEFTDARNNLALAQLAAGRADLARAILVETPDQATAFYNSGIAAMAANDYPAAIEAFDAARRAKPNWGAAVERARQARRLVKASRASQ
jgi:tetratricopeptide (TPR) repeat protein